MTAPTLTPIAPLVAIAWLQTLPVCAGLSIDQPPPNDTPWTWPKWWASSIAVTVSVVPTSPDAYVPIRSPLIQIDVWGRAADGTEQSTRPPWNRCHVIAENIRDATYDAAPGVLVLPGEYKPARVTDVMCTREPSRVPDPSGLARVLTQVQLTYVIDS